jgi:phage terminase small subunit
MVDTAKLFITKELTADERILRDVFVDEYMKDFNSFAAAIRVGFLPAFAREYAKLFMEERYVLVKIHERKMAGTNNVQEEIDKDERIVIATLREAAQNGHAMTRVSAAKTLAQIRGFDKSGNQSEELVQGVVDMFKEIAKTVPT